MFCYLIFNDSRLIMNEEYILDNRRDRLLIEYYTERNLLAINDDLGSSTLTLNAFWIESSDTIASEDGQIMMKKDIQKIMM